MASTKRRSRSRENRRRGPRGPATTLEHGARRAGLHHLRQDQHLDATENRDPREVLVRRGQRDVLIPMANRFLQRFGYLKRHACKADLLCPHVSLSLRRFQAFYRLEETGTFTLETLKLMTRPRCGLPDRTGRDRRSRH